MTAIANRVVNYSLSSIPIPGIVESMISRRAFLLSTLAAGTVARTSFGATGKMTLAIHQNTSAGAGYRKSLEGWARAGIKNVEITSGLLDDFLKTDTLDAARRMLTDNGLTPVSSACGVAALIEPNPRAVRGPGPEPHLHNYRDSGQRAQVHPGRLQKRRCKSARLRRSRAAIQDEGHGGIRARLHVYRHAKHARERHAPGRAFEPRHSLRLLPLLVRQQ